MDIKGPDTASGSKAGHDAPGRSQPSPTDFNVYLAWACEMLEVREPLVVSKMINEDYISIVGQAANKVKAKSKLSKVKVSGGFDDAKDTSFVLPMISFSDLLPGIQIITVYDTCNNLVKLNFDKNPFIPRIIFKIIGLIIQFHYYFYSITINKGLDKYCVYEISKFLQFSRITDLCLDNSFIEEANYHLLLEQGSHLRFLSLSRCSINDSVIEKIAATLFYPCPSSKTLSILNLSSNKITDLGAKFLSEALRSNRQLSYLNLSGNLITDIGVNHLLSTLATFPVTFAELLASRSRFMEYLKHKKDVITQLMIELRNTDYDKRATRRKSVVAKSLPTPKKKGLEREGSLKSVPEAKVAPKDDIVDRATNMAESMLGEFTDPFAKENTFVDDGIVYSRGNNTLAYLGLAYNSLSFVGVKTLLKVLMYQKEMARKPRGLVNISIEGNLLPKSCKELMQIDDLLYTGLMTHSRRYSLPKKRIQALNKTESGR